MRVLVIGASGFAGGRMCPALQEAGHEVHAMTRRSESYRGWARPVRGDVHDADSLAGALAGMDAAYHLVHSLDDPQFAERDAEAARTFAKTAADADDLSEHLRSRREVEQLLGDAGVPSPCCAPGSSSGTAGSPGR